MGDSLQGGVPHMLVPLEAKPEKQAPPVSKEPKVQPFSPSVSFFLFVSVFLGWVPEALPTQPVPAAQLKAWYNDHTQTCTHATAW